MDEQVLKNILAVYELDVKHIGGAQKGYRNESRPITLADGSMCNLIIFKREPHILARIKAADMAGEYAHQRGLPTRTRIDRRILQLTTGPRTTYAALYNYLPGQTIPWEAYTKRHIKLLGQTLRLLHQTLQTAPQTGPAVAVEYMQIVERMQSYFSQSDVQDAMRRKLGLQVDLAQLIHFAQVLRIAQKLPNQQMLHMDFVRGNVLFDETPKVTGIIDFEKTAYGHPLFDIARTLAFLLVDCKHKTPDQVHRYFLYSGYARSTGRIFTTVRIGQLDLLRKLTNLFLLYDFYKFLRHNPYESLGENEHFVRTVAALKI